MLKASSKHWAGAPIPELKRKSLRGGAVRMGSQLGDVVIATGTTMVLARLLDPKEFGFIAMITAVFGLADPLRNIGLTAATVQREHITHDQISTLFWVNIGVGVLLTAATACVSPVLAWFYGNPALLLASLAMSLTFILESLSYQHEALLNRSMEFGRLAVAQLGSRLFGASLAVVLAFSGYGYWSLIWMNLGASLFSSLVIWWLSGWVPGHMVRGVGSRSFLRFGAAVSAGNLADSLSRRVDKILIGRYCGADALGLYGKAYQLLLLTIGQFRRPITGVAVPALSRLQNDRSSYRKYFAKAVQATAFLSMPAAVFLFVYAEELTLLLLGQKWLPTAPLFKALFLAAMIQPVSNARGIVLLSLGRVRKLMHFQIVNGALTMLAFVVGLKWGPIGVASAYSLINAAVLVPSLLYSFRGSPVDLALFVRSTLPSIVASLLMGGILWLARMGSVGWPALATLLVGFGLGTLTYLGTWGLTSRGRSILREFWDYGHYFLPRQKATSVQATP